MTLRKFWKAVMWLRKGRRKHPYYRHISLDNISEVEIMAMEKHERRMSRCR